MRLTIRSMSVGDGGILAAGGSDWQPALWRSPDNGRTWSLLPNPVDRGLFQDGVALTGAATKGDTTLALGLEPTVMRLDGDRWEDATGDQFPKGGEQPFATSIAIGDDSTLLAGGRYRAPSGDDRERYVGQVWNEHGDSWAALDTDHLNAGQIMDVTPYPRGFIAVGFEDFGLAKRRTAGENSSPDGLIWVSEDGRDWSRVGADIPSIDSELIPIIAQNSDDANLPGVIAQTAGEEKAARTYAISIARGLVRDKPIDLTRYQVVNCYMGRAGLINSGGESGKNDFADAVRTAVINKRAGGMGLISGRKAFQRPMSDGVKLLNLIQDVYLAKEITVA